MIEMRDHGLNCLLGSHGLFEDEVKCRKGERSMKISAEKLRLYVVTDRSFLGEETLYEQVEKALKGGATMVQFREKKRNEEAFINEAEELMELCHQYQVPFIVNDYVDLARRIGADGVHIGQTDMEIKEARKILGADRIIGVTAKTIEQAKSAEAEGADYLGSGAVFGSNTKLDAKPMDHALFQEICESVHIPVVAIGGINASNVTGLEGRGMAGVAVVSGIFACKDIEAGTRELRTLVDQLLLNNLVRER